MTQQHMELICSSLELDPHNVDADTLLADVPTFDSAGVVGLVALADRQLGKRLDPDAVVQCETIGDLLRLLGGE